jgi:hypothetical protein
MPDITMCGSETCPLKTKCYRNPASGTEPRGWRQLWFFNKTTEDQGPRSEHYHT